MVAAPDIICPNDDVTFTLTNTGATGGPCDELNLSIATGPIATVWLHPGAGITPLPIPENPVGSGQYPFTQMTAAYPSPGTYQPFIRINYSAGGFTDVAILMQNPIQPPPAGQAYIPAVITVLDVPTISSTAADFTLCDNGINEVTLGGVVSFTGTQSSDIVTVDWGDGNQGSYTVGQFSNPFQVFHQYPGPGLYIIQIGVANMCGSQSFQIPVNITELSADFTYYSGCVNQAALFNFHSPCLVGQSYTLDWYFGDGSVLIGTTNSNPSHHYPAPGNYTVTLVVHANGVSATHTEIITIIDTTPPDVFLPIQNLCNGNHLVLQWANLGNYPLNSALHAVDLSGNLVSFTFGGSASQLVVAGPGKVRIVLTTPDSCTAFTDIEVFDCCANNSYEIITIDTILGGDIPVYDTTYSYGPAQYIFNNTDIWVEIQNGNAPAGGIFNAVIEINGMLVLSESYQFTSCRIFMGPEAQIWVKKDKSVFFTDSEVRACSNVIWNRIYAEGITSSIYSIRSDFYNARRALWVDKGAILSVDRSSFNENHTGIYVSNYWHGAIPALYPSYITNSSFNNEHPGPGNYVPLLYPLHSMEAQYGIHAFMVGRLAVDGHLSGGSANIGNSFYQSLYGIFAENSGLKVLNCSFTNHVSASNAKPHKAGIRATNLVYGRPLPPPLIEVIPGPNTPVPATFNNNTYGILADYVELWASHNVMTDQQTGIKLVEPYRNSYISYNTIINGSTAVLVQNVFEHPTAMNIDYNTISNYHHGIRATNLLNNGVVGLTIKNNEVEFTQTISQMIRTGIRVEACAKATVSGNTVWKNNPLTSGEYAALKGIYISESEGAKVFDNHIAEIGHGIYCIGYLAQAQLYCNTMNACHTGVFLEPGSATVGTVMTHQRTADQAQDNIITNGIAIHQVDGGNGLNNESWRFRQPAVVGSYYNVEQQCFNPVNTNNASCDFPDLPPDEPTYAERVVQDSTEFTNLDEEMDYKARMHIYRDMMDGEFVGLLSYGDSLIFYNFSQQMANSDYGLWEQHLNMLENGELDSAQYYLSLMEATNNLDQNHVTTSELYGLKYAYHNSFDMDEEQSLSWLAYQTPYVAGRAVYSARVMLDIDNLDNGILYKQDPSFDAKLESFELWPNPASNQVQLVFDIECHGRLELTVRDLSGRLVLEQHETIRSEYYSLDLTGIALGLYMLEARLDGVILGTQKLIKQ